MYIICMFILNFSFKQLPKINSRFYRVQIKYVNLKRKTCGYSNIFLKLYSKCFFIVQLIYYCISFNLQYVYYIVKGLKLMFCLSEVFSNFVYFSHILLSLMFTINFFFIFYHLCTFVCSIFILLFRI